MDHKKRDEIENVPWKHDLSSSVGTAIHCVRSSLAPLLSRCKLPKRSHPMVRKQRSVHDRSFFSRMYCLCIGVFQLLPRYLFAFLKKPYRRKISPLAQQVYAQSRKLRGLKQSLPVVSTRVRRRLPLRDRLMDAGYKLSQKLDGVTLQARGNRALYDTLLSFALHGEHKRLGAKPAPGSGHLVYLLIEFARSFDAYLERRLLAGTDLPPLEEVLDSLEIQEHTAAFYRHLDQMSCMLPILMCLWKLCVIYHKSYVQAFDRAVENLGFEETLEVAKIDSGMCCRTIIEVVLLFNGYELVDDLLNDFYLFGMLAKFVDDLADVMSDMQRGLPNLFWASLRQYPEEYALFVPTIRKGKRLTTAWCQKYCPLTYQHYFTYIQHYYEQMHSPQMRKLSLCVLSAPSLIICSFD